MRWKATVCVLALLASDRTSLAQPQRPTPERPESTPPHAAARLAYVDEARKRLGLAPEYANVGNLSGVKIAVLDYGFEGVGSGRRYLPDDTVVVEHYDPEFVRRFHLGDPSYRKPFEPLNRHGRIMAQIVWAMTGSHPDGPKFYLLNASGPTMLRRAVRYAIEHGVNIILFSGSFEGGGNGDGRGFINAIVNEALASDILWINSAGNYGGCVFSGPVRILSDGYLRLGAGADIAALRFRNRLDENTVSVTLTWNDYREQEDAGTSKDLELYVEDWAGRRVGSSEKAQVEGDKIPGPNETRNPRERVVLADLAACPAMPGDANYTYRIRVRAKRGQFTPNDRIRVLVTASREVYETRGSDGPEDAIEFLDATREGEVYPPADNPLVLTVGDSDLSSSVGPTVGRQIKPDVILDDSRAYFTDGQVSAGSSNAAAYLAGVVAVLKAAEPGLRQNHLLLFAQLNKSLREIITAGSAPGSLNPPRRTVDYDRMGIPRSAPASGPSIASTILTDPAKQAGTTLPLDLRLWRTPSRARLSATVRRVR